MIGILSAIVGGILLGGLIFYLMGGKNYVCIRRKDCCGAGCGCLFPKKVNNAAAPPRGEEPAGLSIKSTK
jgi:hypothetical protein